MLAWLLSDNKSTPAEKEGGDILDKALVDAELEEIPGLGTLTARGLTGGDLKVLGRETDGALDGKTL